MNIIAKINFSFALHAMLVLLLLVVAFHLLILANLISYDLVWGGKIESVGQMRVFEITSILINLFMITVVAIKGEYIKASVSNKAITKALWVFTSIFVLNTIGNLLSENQLETLIFTPITFISAILFLRLALEPDTMKSTSTQ
jgi:hypothetical protein